MERELILRVLKRVGKLTPMPTLGRAQGPNTENASSCKHLAIFHQKHYAVHYAGQRRTSHMLNIPALTQYVRNSKSPALLTELISSILVF